MRLFKGLAFAMVGLAIVCYAIADSRLVFGMIMIVLGAIGIALTESRGGRLLPRGVVLGLVALALANAAYAATSGQLTVSAFSEFVTYLQVIKLYDRRRSRDYAQLLSLAVFQVIGAMLTSNALMVGVILVLFVPGMALCASLQQIHSAATQSISPAHLRARGRRAKQDLLTVALVCTLGGVIGGVAAFLFVPRGLGAQRLGEWGNVSLGQTTSFTDTVTLGVGGLISESQAEVLDMAVTNRAGQNIGNASRIFYLRGAVLDTYEKGRWTQGPNRVFQRQSVVPNVPLTVGPPTEHDLNARITIRNASERVAYLFSLWYPTQIALPNGGSLQTGSYGMLLRESPPGKFEYVVRCNPDAVLRGRLAESIRERVSFSERIDELAARVLRDASLDPDPAVRPSAYDRAAAHAFESYLRENYGYTLDIVAAPAGRDATEHFLFSTRNGHCEYFASALAAMCRSVGINARVVTGYVAAEFNESASRYVVRESNAHAWVEAPLGEGRWETLDATPPADLSRIHRPTLGPWAKLMRAFDAVELAWIDGVVGFDERRRAAVVGQDPLNARRLEDRVAAFNTRMSVGGLSLAARAARNALIAFAGVVLIGAGISSLLSVLTTRWRIARALRAARRVDPAIPATLRAGFFVDLQAILRRKGRGRPVWKGALEHAQEVATADPAAGSLPELIRLYYRSRFGTNAITADEERRANAAVAGLKRSLVRKQSPVSLRKRGHGRA